MLRYRRAQSFATILFLVIASVSIGAVAFNLYGGISEQRKFVAAQEEWLGDEKNQRGFKILLRKADDVARLVDKGNIIAENVKGITEGVKDKILPNTNEILRQGVELTKAGTRTLDASTKSLNRITETVDFLMDKGGTVLIHSNEIAINLRDLLADPEVAAAMKRMAGNGERITGNLADLLAKTNVTVQDVNEALPLLLQAVQTIATNSGDITLESAGILHQVNLLFTKVNAKPSKTQRVANILLQALLIVLKNR